MDTDLTELIERGYHRERGGRGRYHRRCHGATVTLEPIREGTKGRDRRIVGWRWIICRSLGPFWLEGPLHTSTDFTDPRDAAAAGEAAALWCSRIVLPPTEPEGSAP